jgi:hypothetical protein
MEVDVELWQGWIVSLLDHGNFQESVMEGFKLSFVLAVKAA